MPSAFWGVTMATDVGLRAVLEPEVDEDAAEREVSSLRRMFEDALSLVPDISLPNMGNFGMGGMGSLMPSMPSFGGNELDKERNEKLDTLIEILDEDFVGQSGGGGGDDGGIMGGGGILSIIKGGGGAGALAPIIAGTLGVGALSAGAYGAGNFINKRFGRFSNESIDKAGNMGSALSRLGGFGGSGLGILTSALGLGSSLALGKGGRKIGEMFGQGDTMAKGQEVIMERLKNIPPLRELLSTDNLPALEDILSIPTTPTFGEIVDLQRVPSLEDVLAIPTTPTLDNILDVPQVPSLNDLLGLPDVPSLDNLLDIPSVPSLSDILDLGQFNPFGGGGGGGNRSSSGNTNPLRIDVSQEFRIDPQRLAQDLQRATEDSAREAIDDLRRQLERELSGPGGGGGGAGRFGGN